MATLTITTTAQQDARIAEAFGAHLRLANAHGDLRNATGAEVKQALIRWLTDIVHSHERSKAATAAAAAVDRITPT